MIDDGGVSSGDGDGDGAGASDASGDAAPSQSVEAFDREPPNDDFLRNCVLNRPVALGDWWVPVALRCLDKHMRTEAALQPWGAVATTVNEGLTLGFRNHSYALRSPLAVRRFIKCFPRAVTIDLASDVTPAQQAEMVALIHGGLKWLRQVTGGSDWQVAVTVQSPQWLRFTHGAGATAVMAAPAPSPYTALRVLNLYCRPELTDAIVAALSTSLRELDIASCNTLTPAASFRHLQRLLTLNVSGCTWVTDASLAGFPPSLRKLSLGSCSMLTHNASLAHLPALRDLSCVETSISAATLESVSPKLECLFCNSCPRLEPGDVKWGTTFPRLRSLTCMLSRPGSTAVLSQTLPETMRELSIALPRTAVGEGDSEVDFSRLSRLRRFDACSSDGLTDRMLATLPLSLRELRIVACASLTPAADLRRFRRLHSLVFDVKLLPCVSGKLPRRLRELKLFGEYSGPQLDLSAFTRLQGLWLPSSDGVTDATIASLLSCAGSLRKVGMDYCTALTPACGPHFRALTRLEDLRCMDCPGIDDSVVAALPPSMMKLHLRACGVTEHVSTAHLPLLRDVVIEERGWSDVSLDEEDDDDEMLDEIEMALALAAADEDDD